MKLIFPCVNDDDSPRLIAAVNRGGYRVTKLHSTGGFLRSGNTTLMTVVEDAEQDEVISIVRKNSKSRKAAINASIPPSNMGASYVPYPVEVNIGGATVFVVPVEHFEKF
ncbi:MAG: hypothetical protein GX838_05440 [Clostridiaceae bacterium]|nr:hypothetical protein [Clostridiaceae bacterium]